MPGPEILRLNKKADGQETAKIGQKQANISEIYSFLFTKYGKKEKIPFL